MRMSSREKSLVLLDTGESVDEWNIRVVHTLLVGGMQCTWHSHIVSI